MQPWEKVTPSDRVWVKHRTNGWIGFLYDAEDGTRRVRLDRPHDPNAHKPYNPGHWEKTKLATRMLKMHVAQVAHAADRELCRFVGRHNAVGKPWSALAQHERIKWADNGPSMETDPVRAKLFAFIHDALKDQTE